MLTTTTTTGFGLGFARFGTLASRGLQLQAAPASASAAVFARPAAACPFSSFAAAIPRAPSTKIQSQLPNRLLQNQLVSNHCRFTARRNASTATNATPGAASAAAANPSRSAAAALDWNTFFQLRKTRRRFQVASSILTTFGGATFGALLLVNQDLEWLTSQIPMDPFFSLGLITLGFAGLGWLAGPSVGSVFFHLFKRGVKVPMAAKEAEFFARIKKNRVDPTTSSVQNPVPDFYGEKISSVAGYRQWLKDQRAFNRKRSIPL